MGRAQTMGIYLLDLLRTQMNYQEIGFIAMSLFNYLPITMMRFGLFMVFPSFVVKN